jgi:hypothetical protein
MAGVTDSGVLAELLRILFLGLALTTVGPVLPAGGQAPPIEGPIYTVIYVEVMPSATAEGLALLKRYRNATRKEEGRLRCELAQRLGNAPTDERVHTALSVGPIVSAPVGNAIYVVTHVDVIPPRKDEGIAAVKQLGEDSRRGVVAWANDCPTRPGTGAARHRAGGTE